MRSLRLLTFIALWLCGISLMGKEYPLITSLPGKIVEARKVAQKGWDSGVETEMKLASAHFNDALVEIIGSLVKTYYRKNSIRQEQIDEYLKGLYAVHRFQQASRNPSGEPTGTTAALDVLTYVTAELESRIADMVQVIVADDPTFDFQAWRKIWSKAVKG